MFLLLLACPKPVGPPEPPARPIHAAWEAPIYTAAPGEAPDPLVAWAARGLSWDESLSGAAGQLGKVVEEQGALDISAVRWAAIRSGWPYDVSRWEQVTVEQDALPEGLIANLAGETRPVGLARYRHGLGDTWVALVGSVQVRLAPFSKEPEIGDGLELVPEAPGWSDWKQRSLPPSATPKSGPVVFGEPGEWLVELSGLSPSGQRQTVLRLPLYVGGEAPVDGPFLDVDTRKPAAAAAPALALGSLNVLRDVLEVGPLEEDPILASVARKELERRNEGGEEGLAPSGYANTAVMECVGPGVQGCVEQFFWSIDDRVPLRDRSYSYAGVAAEWRTGGLVLLVVLAGD